MRIEKSTPQL